MFGSSSSKNDATESMVYGTGDHVKQLLEQHRQMQPKSQQHRDDEVAPSNFWEGCSSNQPGKLLECLQLQNLSPGHYTDFPVPGEERLATSESEGNILIARYIQTPEDYKSGQGSSSTAAYHSASEPIITKSQYVKAAQKQKPTRRISHQKAHKISFRRAEEAAAKAAKVGKTKQQNKNNRRLRGTRTYNKRAELSVEEQAMKAFPGIPIQKAVEAHARREQANVARALSPIFIFDEQRIIMDNFEAENGQQLDRMDQFEHEEEHIGWMVDGGFEGDIDAGGDFAENDLLVMDGFGNQEEDIELALMEGDAAFAQSSLALTPPQL